MTTKKKALAGGTGTDSPTAFPALVSSETDPLKGWFRLANNVMASRKHQRNGGGEQ